MTFKAREKENTNRGENRERENIFSEYPKLIQRLMGKQSTYAQQQHITAQSSHYYNNNNNNSTCVVNCFQCVPFSCLSTY